MRALARLTTQHLDEELRALPAEWKGTPAGDVGAWLDFWGIVREWEDSSHVCGPEREGVAAEAAAHESAAHDGAAHESSAERSDDAAPSAPFRIRALEYEAHPEMAQHQLDRLAHGVAERHGLISLLVLHRVGRVAVGEASLLVRVHAGHRGEALRACAEFIDELKKWVPIWKHAEKA